MHTITRRATAAAVTLATAGVLAGCGGGSGSNVSASGSSAQGMAGMNVSGSAPSAAAQHAQASTMPMKKLGTVTKNGESIELDASNPVTFSVYTGDRLVQHKPTKGQNAHIMLLLSDAQTGDRLPDATVTLRVTDARGRVVASGPQYPMIGMGMGVHYGDNVTLPRNGHYVAQLVVGPPRIGRHTDTVHRWNRTTRMSIPFVWNGSTR